MAAYIYLHTPWLLRITRPNITKQLHVGSSSSFRGPSALTKKKKKKSTSAPHPLQLLPSQGVAWDPSALATLLYPIALGMGSSPPLPISPPYSDDDPLVVVATLLHPQTGVPHRGHRRRRLLRHVASKRRVAPVWALHPPTSYGLRSVPDSRCCSDPRRLLPASRIRGSPCPCAV